MKAQELAAAELALIAEERAALVQRNAALEDQVRIRPVGPNQLCIGSKSFLPSSLSAG